jgi:hypothetical protein
LLLAWTHLKTTTKFVTTDFSSDNFREVAEQLYSPSCDREGEVISDPCWIQFQGLWDHHRLQCKLVDA